MPLKSLSLKSFVTLFLILLAAKVNGQSTEARLILLDSTEFEGYAKVLKNNKILFRMDLEDEPDTWTSEQVRRIEFDNGFKIIAYEYVKFGESRPGLYRVIEPGFLSLYAIDDSYWTPNTPVGNGLMGGSTKVATTSYFLKRKDQIDPCPVSRNKKMWKKRLLECFEDCPEVKEIILSDRVKEYDIEDLVWNYNEYCGGVP
ncbi:hypothetical protein [Flagellimonas sp.]|uniref:hypothetical protein n=1 Tax=Flagellimonas sp. TaxID=2058762 RepID=UPI003B52637F